MRVELTKFAKLLHKWLRARKIEPRKKFGRDSSLFDGWPLPTKTLNQTIELLLCFGEGLRNTFSSAVALPIFPERHQCAYSELGITIFEKKPQALGFACSLNFELWIIYIYIELVSEELCERSVREIHDIAAAHTEEIVDQIGIE